MTVVVLGAKAALAVLLLASGGAKLADPPGFASTVRLFAPRRAHPRLLRAVALGVAIGEIAAGAASLTSPRVGWLNLVVLAAGCGFLVVSVAGYARHAGRPCQCFGALSRRGFGVAAVGRAAVIALAAAVAARPVGPSVLQVGAAGRLALAAGALLVAAGAFSAAATATAAGTATAAATAATAGPADPVPGPRPGRVP